MISHERQLVTSTYGCCRPADGRRRRALEDSRYACLPARILRSRRVTLAALVPSATTVRPRRLEKSAEPLNSCFVSCRDPCALPPFAGRMGRS
eukprot:7384191-Prymnesium_polylepis.1